MVRKKKKSNIFLAILALVLIIITGLILFIGAWLLSLLIGSSIILVLLWAYIVILGVIGWVRMINLFGDYVKEKWLR